MANEIRVVHVQRRDQGYATVTCLFLHLMIPPLETADGLQIAPTPQLTLPAEVTELQLLESFELTALNDGVAVFESKPVNITPEELANLALAVARLRSDYAASDFVANLRLKYQFTGVKVDA